jgi:hypothetical protein
MFGTFTWELTPDSCGNMLCRPIFLLNDSFIKDFRVKQQRVYYFPNLSPNEEINFSKLAIKFTRNLTKDMLFASIRDIIRKIGDFILRNYEIEIQFNFGKLKVKNRRLRFIFDYSRFSEVKLSCQ